VGRPPGSYGETMNRSFYKNRVVLITGHTGFKGSWLALWLKKLGARVLGLSLKPNTSPSHYQLIGLRDILDKEYIGDIRDYELVKNVFKRHKPEIVFHLAAQPLVRDSYIIPKDTFDINIGGTVNLLEAIRQAGCVRSAVFITSDKCYENMEWIWGYREDDKLGGYDPYSASKGAMEIVCQSYLRSFFKKDAEGPYLGFATTRAGNVIGGGDWAKDRLIPDCVRALSQNKIIIIRNPDSTRPWQLVLEPLYGYIMLAERLYKEPDRFSTPFNFGPFEIAHICVEELVKKFISIWGKGRYRVIRSRGMHEAGLLRLVIDKAVNLLGWRPVLSSEEAIEWTANWYREWNSGNKNLREFSIKQIEEYEALVRKVSCR